MATTTLAPKVLTINTTGNVIAVTGSGTSWVNGTTTFSISGGTGASITAQSVTNSTTASITVSPGSAVAFLTISNNTDASTATITVYPVWYTKYNYVPSGGPIAAAANPGSIQAGWIDYSGSIWSINSSNQIASTAPTNGQYAGLLLRPTSDNPSDGNAQQQVNFIASASGILGLVFRVTNPGGTSCNSYAAEINLAGASTFLRVATEIAGVLTTLSTSAAITLTAGTAYYAIASAIQSNSTTTTISIAVYLASNSTQVGTTLITTDTTAALQYPTTNGQTGFWSGSSTCYITGITYAIDSVPANATGYTVSFASAYGLVGNAVNGLINLTGGQTLTAPLVVTITDANGTTVSNPTTVNSGQAAVSFAYTANTLGTHTISFSHTGGNGGMSDPGSATFTTTGSNTWYQVSNYTPSGGPVAAAPSPGSIGGGWIDETGNSWSINASNQLECSTSYPAGFLLRPVSENPTDYNAQITTYFVAPASFEVLTWHRLTSPIGSPSGYLLGLIGNASSIALYFKEVQSGTITNISTTNTGSTAALTVGATYYLTTSVQQIGATQTQVKIALYNSSNTLIYSGSGTDTTSALQNATGQTGVAVNGNPNYTQIITYTDIAPTSATGYTISLAQSSGQANLPIQGTVAMTGGNILTSPIVITLADTLGSTLTGSPITIPSGSTYGYFTFTPTATGSHSISGTHTGGNTGMTDSSPATYTATASGPMLLPNNPAQCTLSPLNWCPDANQTGAMQTWNTGAYARFATISNCASVYLMMDPASVGLFLYQIDEGPLNAATGSGVSGLGIYQITLPDTGPHTIWVKHYSISQYVQRWNGTAFLGVFGLLLPGGGTYANASPNSLSILMHGDSIWEGILANNGADGNTYDSSYYLGEALYQQGFEYSLVACGNLGYSVNGDSVPQLYNPSNSTNQSWDKINANYSRLTSGRFTVQPNIIICELGTNDALHGSTGTTLQAIMVAQWQHWRTAAPNALIIKAIPFGGYSRADIQAAYATYQAAGADAKMILIDLAIDSRVNGSGPACYALTGGELHPGIWGHANIASLLLPLVRAAYDTANAPGGTSSGYHGQYWYN